MRIQAEDPEQVMEVWETVATDRLGREVVARG